MVSAEVSLELIRLSTRAAIGLSKNKVASLKVSQTELSGGPSNDIVVISRGTGVVLFRRRCVAASKNDKGREVMQLRTGCAERVYSEKEKTPSINGIQ